MPSIQTQSGVMPKALHGSTLPLFLEGPARFFGQKRVYKANPYGKAVRRALFDQECSACTKYIAPCVSFDIGRIAFSSGMARTSPYGYMVQISSCPS